MSWELQPISSFAQVGAGQGAPQQADEFDLEGHPFVRAGSLERLCAGADENLLERIPDSVAKAKRMTLYPAGTILFAKSGMSATLGRVYKLTKPCYVVNHLATINTQAGTDVDFLAQFFRFSSPARLINDGAYPSIRLSDISTWEIPLPPLEEQRRIAAVLDKADALRRQRQESLQLTEKLLQSVFIDMFGDPVTNPRGYRAKTLKEWGRVSTGTTPKSSKEGMFGGAIPFVTPGDLKETWVQTVRTVTAEGAENSRTVRKGATLVCCIGATIGKMGKAAQTSAFNQQVNAIEWYDEVLDDYGLEAMRFLKRTIIQNGSAATLPILNKSAFQSLELPVAPIEEQKRFIEVVRLLERVKADSVESADEAEKMFSSLQQRAFRGELDLSRIVFDPADDVPPTTAPAMTAAQNANPKIVVSFLSTPPAIEDELNALDTTSETH
jgi:type I restriction enzyme S subunit